MKIKVYENTNHFTVELTPDDIQEANLITRLSLLSRSKDESRVSASFYNDGTIRGYIEIKKNRNKPAHTQNKSIKY